MFSLLSFVHNMNKSSPAQKPMEKDSAIHPAILRIKQMSNPRTNDGKSTKLLSEFFKTVESSTSDLPASLSTTPVSEINRNIESPALSINPSASFGQNP